MKLINEYKKLFNVEKNIDLKELKVTYRTLVKEWHPDKFQANDQLAQEAELKSRQIIDGYHFLVSISEETKLANLEEYNKTITECGITDFEHKGLVFKISFTDGSSYEYYGVNKNVFNKLLNSDNQLRFARRNIFNTFTYRKTKKALQEV